MTPDVLDRLRSIGCNETVARALDGLAARGQPMRVTAIQRESATLSDGTTELRATLAPRLGRDLAPRGESLTVGDWVLATGAEDAAQITARMPPLTEIVRRASDGMRQALVSNVDVALLVMGLDGDFNPRRLERYLVMVQAAGVHPVVVLTKPDLADTATALVAGLQRRVSAAVPVRVVDARSQNAAAALQDVLRPGTTLVLLGSSGVGKSTLTNTLAGGPLQTIGAVRPSDSRGRHTTTTRTLVPLPGGACVIDTPGLRGLEMHAGEEGLAAGFADIAALASHCRFRDCSHGGEPGCVVRSGIDPDRLANFHKLKRELRRDSMTFLDRRRQLAEWKARGRLAEQRMKMKRG
ncbi:MAG TPA: ribosome small subunit-dependent GTPase A [Burkholderiaceae bacterium]|nr:ribosome small subunit-dependent GTPase A [Burkholderiaceae bacterium]